MPVDPSYDYNNAVVGFQSLLTLSGPGLPLYSARGLTQTLQYIGQATQLRRTVNALLRDLSLPQFRKFAVTISCSDQRPPYAYIPGTDVTLESAQRLGYRTAGGTPERTVVENSILHEGEWTFYRPELLMKVVSWSMNFEEWKAGQSWSMQLEER